MYATAVSAVPTSENVLVSRTADTAVARGRVFFNGLLTESWERVLGTGSGDGFWGRIQRQSSMVKLMVKQELAAVEQGPEDVFETLIGVGSFGEERLQRRHFLLGRFA